MVPPSAASLVAFVAVVLFVCGAVVAGIGATAPPGKAARHAGLALAGVLGVLAISGVLAGSGAVGAVAGTPLAMAFPFVWFAVALAVALGPVGRRLAMRVPPWALIGVHGFRLPLELVLERWHAEGVIPVQMTYHSWNLDIITGVLALALGALGLAVRLPRWVLLAFTVVGSALLFNVVTVAFLSIPSPFRQFTAEPMLQLPFHVPTVWIISVCVQGALLAHVLAVRRLRSP